MLHAFDMGASLKLLDNRLFLILLTRDVYAKLIYKYIIYEAPGS
jgi:hypothetical protein